MTNSYANKIQLVMLNSESNEYKCVRVPAIN